MEKKEKGKGKENKGVSALHIAPCHRSSLPSPSPSPIMNKVEEPDIPRTPPAIQ
jgi:hypothetical protein